MNSSTLEKRREGRSRLSTAALLLAGVGSLWLLRSSVIEVYAESDEVSGIDLRWLLAILTCEVLAFTAAWQLNRIALRTDRWFDVAVAQLSGNAATNVIPAGAPVGAAVQLRILSEAGFDLTSAATSLGALSLVGAAGLLAVPAIALPFALAAGDSDRHLEAALAVGVGLLLALLAVGVALLRHDRPLRKLAGGVQWIENLFRPRAARRRDLPDRVLGERDSIRDAFREQPATLLAVAVGRSAFDCLALYLSLVAVGAHPTALAALTAFGASNVAGMIPITPGGLGFVEAGITGTLVASGVSTQHALLAAALYRLANTWLPVLVGFVAYAIFRHRLQRRGPEIERAHAAEQEDGAP